MLVFRGTCTRCETQKAKKKGESLKRPQLQRTMPLDAQNRTRRRVRTGASFLVCVLFRDGPKNAISNHPLGQVKPQKNSKKGESLNHPRLNHTKPSFIARDFQKGSLASLAHLLPLPLPLPFSIRICSDSTKLAQWPNLSAPRITKRTPARCFDRREMRIWVVDVR